MGNNSSKKLEQSAKVNNNNNNNNNSVYDADEDWVQTVKRAEEMRNRYVSSVGCTDLHKCPIVGSDEDGYDGADGGDNKADDDDAKESLISTNMNDDDIDDDQSDGLVNQMANLKCTEPLKQSTLLHSKPQFKIVASECEVLSLSVQSELYALKLDQIITIRMCSSETSRLAQLKCCYLHCHPMTTISMVKQYVAFHTLLITDFHQLIDLELTGCKGIKLHNHFTLQFVQNSIWSKKCNRVLEVISEEEEEDVAMAIENGQDYMAAIKESRSHQYMTLYYSIRNID